MPRTTPVGELLDLALVAAARFECRPSCALCCYATPAVTREERERLVQIEPLLSFDAGPGSGAYLPSRGDGGACVALSGDRCRVRSARPFPCRAFPVHTHVGARVQVSLVLSCPGIDGAVLAERRTAPAAELAPAGLDQEIGSVREAMAAAPWPRWIAQNLRRWHRRFADVEPRAPQLGAAEVEGHGLYPRDADFPVEDPPSVQQGVEFLPVFHEPGVGTVAVAAHDVGWELLVLRPDGGTPRSLGVFSPPHRPPPLQPAAQGLLRAYLATVAGRDATLWAAALDSPDGAALQAHWRASVRQAGALALARARVLHELHGALPGPLNARELLAGIRATDADVLDRPTWGHRL